MKANNRIALACPEEGDSGAVYLRSATSGPEGDASLEIQREEVLALSDSLGVTVPPDRILSEVASGISPDRPAGLQALWDLVENEAVQHIFVRDVSRLGRDIPGVLRFVRHCKDHGVLLHFAEDHR